MSVPFAFEPGGSDLDPASPFIDVRITFRGVTEVVRALYDTGTDVTHLGAHWKAVFGVDESLLPKLPVKSASGKEAAGALAFVDGELDGHTFKLPVLFHPKAEVDLFGRSGLGESFIFELDPGASETRVTRLDVVPETSADREYKTLTSKPGVFGKGWDAPPPS